MVSFSPYKRTSYSTSIIKLLARKKNMNSKSFLLPLLIALLSATAHCLPIKTQDNNETLEERHIIFDPTADTDFTIRVGDITYFTKSYEELLNKKLANQEGANSHEKGKRAVPVNENRLWTNCVLPYTINDHYTDNQKRVILQALAHWEEHTCVRFIERTSETDYIHIYPGYGCSSFVGKTSRQQRVSVGFTCFSIQTAVHEIGHAIGFYHEHNRPDRDDYIKIIFENIRSGFQMQRQFEKLNSDDVNLLGFGYDYNSIMHYDKDAFNKYNHLDTIVAHDPSIPIGLAPGLSPLDILKTNRLCGCSNSTEDHPPRNIFVPEEPVTKHPLPPHKFECGAVLDGVSSGSFSSPNYGVYPHNTDCEWTIRVQEGYQIIMTLDLDMDYSDGCADDYLQIHERLDRTGHPIGNYCQSNHHTLSHTMTNTAYIRFHTNGFNQRSNLKGFSVSFEAKDFDECRAGFCSHYCTNLPGSYQCSCPKGFYLSDDMNNCFDVNECALDKGGCDHKCVNRGGHFHCECDEGYTLLSDGKTCLEDTEEIVDPCLSVECEHSCVVIVGDLPTAQCTCPKGFELSPDGLSCAEVNECLISNGGCHSNCTNTEGSYECSCSIGNILADDGFACEDIDECLNDNGGCSDDCVNTKGSYHCLCEMGYELKEDDHTCEELPLQIVEKTTLPSTTQPPPTQPPTLPPTTRPPTAICGGILTAGSGSLQTPNWPQTYPFNFQCEWTIQPVSSGCSIQITFNSQSFGIAGSLAADGCTRDYLRIFNSNGAQISNICGLNSPSPITTTGTTRLLFNSGPSHGPLRTRVRVDYTTVCPTAPPPTTIATTTPRPTTQPTTLPPTTAPLPDNVLVTQTGSIQSPNWPVTYPVNIDREWFIRCPPQFSRIIILVNSSFWIGGRQDRLCAGKDWLQVYAGENVFGARFGPYCQNVPPAPFVVESNRALVKFHAGERHQPTRIGFSLTYHCV